MNHSTNSPEIIFKIKKPLLDVESGISFSSEEVDRPAMQRVSTGGGMRAFDEPRAATRLIDLGHPHWHAVGHSTIHVCVSEDYRQLSHPQINFRIKSIRLVADRRFQRNNFSIRVSREFVVIVYDFQKLPHFGHLD